MKYIMLKRKIHGNLEQRIPIIFPDLLIHADVAQMMKSLPELKDSEVVSAGEFSGIEGECCGKSVSLGVKSEREDTHTINMMDYLHGILR